jgi:hypothetical protein
MNAIRDFFTRYEAVRVDGVPASEQEAYVRAEWARREAGAQMREITELTTLLTQDVVPVAEPERAILRAKLDVAWARLEGAAPRGGRVCPSCGQALLRREIHCPACRVVRPYVPRGTYQ